jgi:acyl-CoA synthetase (AMP-forming)/AMP-acid ligase II
MAIAHFDAPEPLLPDLIDRQSRWLGEKPAMICDNLVWSWHTFGTRLRHFAARLRASGIEAGDRVVVVMDNSPEMLETLFGVIRAGACVVPLNVSVSADSMAAMIDDCEASAVIVSEAYRASLRTSRHSRVKLWISALETTHHKLASPWQSYSAWLEQPVDTALRTAIETLRVAPDGLCNIIYSSGTTGVPKGITHDHRRRMAWALSVAIALRYDSRAITLCPIGLYSNISWVSMLSTFVVGGTLVIERRFEPEKVLRSIESRHISHGSLVPIIVQRLLECPLFGKTDMSSLRALMCCGSPLTLPIKQRALKDFGCAFIELYGLTEGVITTLDPEDAEGRELSVGKPLPGTDIQLIDEFDRAVTAGESGEIVARGHITMTGYYRRPEANAESTWRDEDGVVWLRTGDIGRLDEAGYLYIVDRKKDMIISGGQNVYPADIESVAVSHPSIAEIAVIGVKSEKWGETPYAIVVPRQNVGACDSLAIELRDWINSKVGRQQRVAGVAIVDALPRNPNGKVLKRELRKTHAHLESHVA